MVNEHFEQNVNSNRKGTDKINSISENLTKIKVFFIFSQSLTPQTRNIGCPCAHVFQKRTCGALIGACAPNRANTVFVLSYFPFLFWGQEFGSDSTSSWSLLTFSLF